MVKNGWGYTSVLLVYLHGMYSDNFTFQFSIQLNIGPFNIKCMPDIFSA